MSGGGGHGGGGKRRGHEEEHEEHENHERWLVSYADMMTLLMVLFIVMFAISQVDSKKFMALKNGLESGFGSPLSMLDGADDLLSVGGHIAPDSVNLAGVAGNKNADPNESQNNDGLKSELNPEVIADLVNQTNKAAVKREVENLKKAQEDLKKALAAAGAAQGATFRFNEQGLVVSIATDKVLYASGGATMLPTGRKILDALAPTLRKLPNRLSIDGHTDSNPIATAQFPTNWELSTARATGVLRYLHSAHAFPFSRMFATGYADTRPLKPGKGAAAMTANRRVEIIVVARVDNSAGRAIESLGNPTAVDQERTPTPTPAPAATPTPTAKPRAPAASPKPTVKTTPKPTRTSTNILGLEPNTVTG